MKSEFLFLLTICLLSNTFTAHARRSRIDAPVASKAENTTKVVTNNNLKKNVETQSKSSLLPAAQYSAAESDELVSEELLNQNSKEKELSSCNADLLGYEIITGYVLSAPDKLMDSLPGTLMLIDCLTACRNNATCQSINYETGLCVLFSATADDMPGSLNKSQFPVFTIYAQKTCLSKPQCSRAWLVDRVQNYKLKGYSKRTVSVKSRLECMEECLEEKNFKCRSANYDRRLNICELSDMDRITLAGRSNVFQSSKSIDYLENNCIEEPNKLCEFKRLPGRILKTVDSVFQDVGSNNDCRDLCMISPYRCHSYDYGDTGESVCRLSHHSRATLFDVQEPYLSIPEATTYELSYCYNVTVDCGAGDMITRVHTSKLFNGKFYAKGSPKSCSVDVKNSLEFELGMKYQDIECSVHQLANLGRFTNDIVIQHHDMIVTSSDLGLAVACQYDFTNKSIKTDFDLLSVRGDIIPELTEEVIVDSPNVIMKITSRDGANIMRSAQVGDPLALTFKILDANSPYEIFVRELVAMDGGDNGEITLIDENGCPTDEFVMGPILKSTPTGKVLMSHFDAFKFPSSEVVQFRALVTPCMPKCEPVECEQSEYGGEAKSSLSFGRRRRSIDKKEHTKRDVSTSLTRKSSQDNMLLVQSIKIRDKFKFEKQKSPKSTDFDSNETIFITDEAQGLCVNGIGLFAAAAAFIIAQLVIVFVWAYVRHRQRKLKYFDNQTLNSAGSSYCYPPVTHSVVRGNTPNSNSEALNQLYDNKVHSRYGQQY